MMAPFRDATGAELHGKFDALDVDIERTILDAPEPIAQAFEPGIINTAAVQMREDEPRFRVARQRIKKAIAPIGPWDKAVAAHVKSLNGEDADDVFATPKRPARHGGRALSDLGNAERFVDRHGANVRFDVVAEQWLEWDGTRWTRDTRRGVIRRGWETVRAIHSEASGAGDPDTAKAIGKHAIGSEKSDRIAALLKVAQSSASVVIEPDQFDVDPWALCVQNGVVDLQTGTLRPHRREDLFTRIAPITFDADAKCPRFDQFFEEIFLGDKGLIEFAWRSIGYSLTADTREQCFFFCYGTGSNGKTKLFEILQRLLGSYGHTADFSTFTANDKPTAGTPRPDLVRLRGMRLVSAAEADQQVRFSEATLKKITGEDPVTARDMYEREQTFTPILKLWLMANHKPRVNESNHGFWRRVRLIPFDAKFDVGGKTPPDKTLVGTLRAELPGVLAHAVRACIDWQRNGLGMSDAVTNATAEYRTDSDPVGRFLDAWYTTGHDRAIRVRATELHMRYCEWASANGAHAFTANVFSVRMEERKDRIPKVRPGGSAWYVGIREKTIEEHAKEAAERKKAEEQEAKARDEPSPHFVGPVGTNPPKSSYENTVAKVTQERPNSPHCVGAPDPADDAERAAIEVDCLGTTSEVSP